MNQANYNTLMRTFPLYEEFIKHLGTIENSTDRFMKIWKKFK